MKRILFLLTLVLMGIGIINTARIYVASSGSRIYVANSGSNTVSVIDGASNTVVAMIPVGVNPRGMAANQSTKIVYVANISSDSISIIDGNPSSPTFNTVTAMILVGSLPLGIAVNPVTNLIYVANLVSGTVSVIDGNPSSPTFHTIVRTISTGFFSFAIAINPNTNLIYLTNPNNGTVQAIDGNSNNVVATIALSQGGGVGAAINLQTNRMYIAAEGGRPVYVVDVDPSSPTFHSVIKEINLPSPQNPGCCPFDVDVNMATDTFYAPDQRTDGASPGGGNVAIFDGTTDSLIGTIPVGTAPQFLAVDRTNNRLYVSNTDGNNISALDSVSVIDIDPGAPTFHTVIATITEGIGIRPGDLAVMEDARQLEVGIDIKPGSFPNSINPRSKGVISVAILTTENFDATAVNPMSVRFGPNGAMETHRQGHIEDADGDGDLDLVLHFRTQEAGIQCGATLASLIGDTFSGQAISGSDSTNTVECR